MNIRKVYYTFDEQKNLIETINREDRASLIDLLNYLDHQGKNNYATLQPIWLKIKSCIKVTHLNSALMEMIDKVDKKFMQVMGQERKELQQEEVRSKAFFNSLQQWLDNPAVKGKKLVAMQRILTCYKEKQDHLDLANLSLSHLPDVIQRLGHLKRLDLCRNRLSMLPESIGKLTQLTSLQVDSNCLEQLPEWIGNLTSLRELDLQRNSLYALPGSIAHLTQLKELKLTKNNFNEVPPAIAALNQLRLLSLGDNRLKKLPAFIENLVSLKHLCLENNQLTELPSSIVKLKELEILDLEENKLQHLPDSIGHLTKLHSLFLSSNQLARLPASIVQLAQLTHLNLSNNALKELPELIGKMSQLNELFLNKNKITQLPNSITQLTKLTHLYLDENYLEKLPDSIGNLTQLVELYLEDNELKILPNSIGELKLLHILNLRGNFLEELPSFKNFSQIISLDLNGNRLSNLPTSITKLKTLTSLDLGNNSLQSLPITIHFLKELEVLCLSNNLLWDLPEEIGQLTSLLELYLNKNQLKEIPNSIGNLSQLTEINLASNYLSTLPQEIIQCQNLAKLNLMANPTLSSLPQGIQELQNRGCRIKAKQTISTLSFLLNKWIAKANKNEDSLNNRDNLVTEIEKAINPQQREELCIWLNRLKKTKEFEVAKASLAINTIKMVQGLLKSKEFKDSFFNHIAVNNVACEDRTTLAYNEIYLAYLLQVEGKLLDDHEKLLLLIKAARTCALTNALSELILEYESEKGVALAESSEIYLYYLIHFSHSMELLLAIRTMYYADGWGKQDWMEQKIETLKILTAQKLMKELAALPLFEQFLQAKETFRANWQQITDHSYQLLENLDPISMNEQAYLDAVNQIGQNKKSSEKQLLEKWAQKLIEENENLILVE